MLDLLLLVVNFKQVIISVDLLLNVWHYTDNIKFVTFKRFFKRREINELILKEEAYPVVREL